MTRADQAAAAKLDAVLPLTRDDFARFEQILHPSLERFSLPLRSCMIVTPTKDFRFVRSRCPQGPYRVVDELELVPELEGAPARGWFKQQLVKLSFARLAATAVYLTLDTDVFCVRSAGYDELVPDGRSLMSVTRSGLHRNWYRWSARLLGVDWTGTTHGVTPALMSSEAVILLLTTLEARWAAEGDDRRRAESGLLERLPWTEYSLYGLFLETHGLLERYHQIIDRPLYCNCVWADQATRFAAWDPACSFSGRHHRYFSTIQSTSGISVAAIRRRIEPYLVAERSTVGY